MLILQQIPAGGDRNFGYIVGCSRTGDGAVIDPSMDASLLCAYIERYKIDIKYLINTHSHYDHVTENNRFIEAGAELLEAGDSDETVKVGDWNVHLIPTPGHTDDSICIRVEDHIITGDTLFVGKVGGTGSRESAEKEFISLKKLMELPENTKVWPGHNYGAKNMSTIREEKDSNPFCTRLDSIDSFLWIKDNWSSYKTEHFLI